MTDLLERQATAGERRTMGDEPQRSPAASLRRSPAVLMVGASPPPYYGSIVIFGRLMGSPLREQFRLIQLDISDHRDVSNVGRFDLENVRLGIRHALACHRALKVERPDLVYVPIAQNTLAFFRDSLFLLLARRHGLRRVVHVHGGFFGEFYRQAPAPLRAYIRWTLKGVSAAVVNSEMLASMFTGLLPRERVWPVPIGIEDIPEPILAQPRPARPPTVLYFGTLVETKGFLDVMAAAPLVAREIPDVRFVIAGGYFTPGDREKAERLLQDPAIRARVALPGVITGDARFALLLDADVFAFPTYYPIEGQPAVIVEAMSAGLPVVTTDQGAIRETIVDGESGYLVPKRDPEALARRLVDLLRDAPLRRTMGQAGRRRFEERFRIESYGLGMARVFDTALREE